MSGTTTFDRSALSELPSAPGYIEELRREAFERFETLPIPSQETEEWRYTDLSDLELSFLPHVPGHGRNMPGVEGERAGVQLQHDSSVAMTTSNQDLEERGVIFCDLDEAAAKHEELVAPHLHRLVRTDRTKFSALHGAFRTGGTFLYVPPGATVDLPLQTLTYLDEENGAVFPHTLLVAGADSEVTFIDR